jgi:hypothetical protein
MNSEIIAYIIHRMSPMGMLSLTAIPCLIIVLLAYQKGTIAGGSTCLMLFFISTWLTGSNAESDLGRETGYITTELKHKWTKAPSPGAISSGTLLCGDCFEKMLFLPEEEIIVIDGTKRLRPKGRKINFADYYILEDVYARANVPRKYGGWGIPCWLYHPAALNWTFLLGALPILGLGAVIKKQLK